MAPVTRCVICDETLRHALAKYCRRCGNIIDRVETHGKADIASLVKALQNSWDAESDCFRCYYSGIRLVDANPRDPRYVTFDRLTPRKEGDLVITASLIHDMKTGLSLDEFKTIVNQLAKHFENGLEVDEDIFKLKYYQR
jgi:hypothetical protein